MSQVSILLVPLALLAVALRTAFLLRRRLMIRRHWKTADASIVSLTSSPATSPEGARLLTVTRLSFEFGAHASRYSVRQSISGSLDAEPGSRIHIFNNPDDPNQASIDLSDNMIASRILIESTLAIGGAIFVAGILYPFRCNLPSRPSVPPPTNSLEPTWPAGLANWRSSIDSGLPAGVSYRGTGLYHLSGLPALVCYAQAALPAPAGRSKILVIFQGSSRGR